MAEKVDHDGYYRPKPNEVLNRRFRVTGVIGKGVFGCVVRAHDLQNECESAVKIMRGNDLMFRAGMREASLLRLLNDADKGDHTAIVRMKDSFEHAGHYCISFELLKMNMRELLEQYGRRAGLHIKAVRAYAHQLLSALDLLEKNKIVHADIKPDNILVSESLSRVRLSDFGSGCLASQRDITPYVASRFYRAPEVILGIPSAYSIDIWALGCTLYELYTGRVLFPGESNNDMLRLIMEKRGPFTPKVLKRGAFSGKHFDLADRCAFLRHELDGGELSVRKEFLFSPKHFEREFNDSFSKTPEAQMIRSFAGLLEGLLALNPEKRMSAGEALRHDFFK